MADNRLLPGSVARTVNRDRKANKLLGGLSPEEEYLQNLSPVDAYKFGNEAENARVYTPEQASANLRQTGMDALYATPIIGNILSAGDAYDYGKETLSATNDSDRRKNALLTELSALGAIPFLPFGGTGRAVEGAASRTNIFAGPMAKTANHEALSRAKHLENMGASRDWIRQQTGWTKDTGGNWRFEIDDSGMRVGRGDQGGISGEILDHPELAKAYPQLEKLPVSIDAERPGDRMSFYNPQETGAPKLTVRGRPEQRRSTSVHELQHAVDDLEGLLGPNIPYETPAQAYRSLSEVTARNAQWRLEMNAAERRAKAPWLTQDVPDEQQIIRSR